MSAGRRVALGAAFFWCCLVAACTGQASQPSRIVDDLDRPGLVVALSRSLAHLESLPAATRFSLGHSQVPVTRLIDSARHLRNLMRGPLDDTQLAQRISEDFIAFRRYPENPQQRLLVTGYYQPVFSGSLQRRAPYLHPLHRRPDDLVVRREEGRKPRIGRIFQGRFLPYWTRSQIEEGNLLKGGELVWLRDPFDAFTLHVQGSGIVRLTDGTLRGVRFAQKNGHPYTSIGKYLVDTGRMRLAEVTMDSIREYLRQHPHEQLGIMRQNDSYIFFDWTPPGPAIGNINQELIPGRSVAADQRCYPPGSILWLRSRRPVLERGIVVGWQSMDRLVSVHDTGSALNGPGRIDIFWGTGDRAGQEAGQMKERGEVVVLLRRQQVSTPP